jgi:hypothetical protein
LVHAPASKTKAMITPPRARQPTSRRAPGRRQEGSAPTDGGIFSSANALACAAAVTAQPSPIEEGISVMEPPSKSNGERDIFGLLRLPSNL